jgi:hypothetical protein
MNLKYIATIIFALAIGVLIYCFWPSPKKNNETKIVNGNKEGWDGWQVGDTSSKVVDVFINYPADNYIEMTVPEILTAMRRIYDSSVKYGLNVMFVTPSPRAEFTADEYKRLNAVAKKIKEAFPNNYVELYNYYEGKTKPVQ